MESRRRQAVQESLNLTTQKETEQIQKSIQEEQQRIRDKEERRRVLEEDDSYVLVRGIATLMDKWFLDPIIGFFIPAFGDALTSVMTLPYIYVSLFKIKSIPLTLAIIYNALMDALIGSIPFFIGDVLDALHRSYKKSYALIVGFVEDDKNVIREVNGKALKCFIFIIIFCIAIYFLVSWTISLVNTVWEFLASLIAS